MASKRTRPSQEELNSLNLACQHLWDIDVNRMKPGVDYALNLQGGKKPWETYDAADQKLFKFLDRDKFFSIPSFATFYALLDNYERSTGASEEVSQQEKKENWDFLDAVMATPCMQYVHEYLVAKGVADAAPQQFKFELYKIWFYLYRREASNDSSGFEHVFVGEEKDGKVTGFHNWVQFFIEERKGTLDYKGYILPKRRSSDGVDDDQHVLTLQFSWGDELKSLSTSFIGVSPEFELGLYTLCLLAGQNQKTDVELDDMDLSIVCYRIAGNKIGSSYPEIRS